MRTFLPLLAASLPLGPALAGALAGGLRPSEAGRLACRASRLALVSAAAASAWLCVSGGVATARWSPIGDGSPFAVGVRFDALSATLAVLVTFVGDAVMRFSRHYMSGDRREAAFYRWLCLALASVLSLVVSGNFLQLLAAWVATSVCLHRLLLHHGDRPGAVAAARKKFVFSRAGDLCLAAAAWLLYRAFGTLDFDRLFAGAAGARDLPLGAVGLLLVAGAALKSAQFPFHSWLPDTMETPTPVSAFMHAGIINAGGFLIIRMSPLMAVAGHSLEVLAVLGALTAAFGSVVMLAQASVKRSLAYSTIAQMGFMMLQCGLGAFGLAALHLVAHSLYKAHAFLRAGSTVGAAPRAAVALRTGAIAAGVVASVALMAAAGRVGPGLHGPAGLFFAAVAGFGLAYGLSRAWSVARGPGRALAAAAVAAAFAFGLPWLHAAAQALGGDASYAPPRALVAAAIAVFAVLFGFQSLLWRTPRTDLGRRLYVHALNGFYIGTFINRLLHRLWIEPAAPVAGEEVRHAG